MTIEGDILIIDDEIPSLRLLVEMLEKEGYQVRPADKPQMALEAALAEPPGLILLDVRMPEMNGFELCRRLKQDERTQHVPILFLSALDDLGAKVKGFEAGGVDFITKPFQEMEILARVKTHMSLFRMQLRLELLISERTVQLEAEITEHKQSAIKLREAYTEIEQLRIQLEAESAYLQDEIKQEHNFKNIIGKSESLKYVLNRVEQVALTDSPVMIMGETGTGKEIMVRALHQISSRGSRTLVKVNCAALPRDLIESELFGREKGAFTGATSTQAGRFELAKGSTIFLDEIGELPIDLQPKLLRVIESGEFERLGSSRTLHSDARIIAATNRVLEEEVRKGRFREDLWYRLNVFPITVPPLRERPEDIPLLAKWFVDQLSRKMGKRVAEIPKRTMQMLQSYPWPGNVRELMHAVESALILARGEKLNFDLPQIADTAFTDFKSFEEMERDYILQVLKTKNWRIGGENSAASTLGMHINTLRGRMKRLGIKRPKPQ